MKRGEQSGIEINGSGETLTHLADLLILAGEYFLKGPEPRLEALLVDAEWNANLHRAGLVEVASGVERFDPAGHRQVFMETTRVPGDAFIPPFEEAHSESGSTDALPVHAACQQIFDLAGYDKRPFESFQSDHVGHQLRFLGAISAREAECKRRGDTVAAEKVATWRRGFSRQHCGWWIELASRIDDSSNCAQIRTVAALIRGLQGILERG